MKLISWNVNGIRAVARKGLFDWWIAEKPDFFCIQETKATEDQVPPEAKNIKGYSHYFNWPTEKKGYSGVAIYSKHKPEEVSFGMDTPAFDTEGRLMALHFKGLSVINIYFPNGGGGPERLRYKLDFYDAFLHFIQELRKKGQKVIFCGDINTAHEEIDLARPKENEKNTGFLPEERAWLDQVASNGYIDTFRFLHPGKKDIYSYWDMKTAARERNVGWRIDYVYISPDLQKDLKKAFVLDAVIGSDHCPVGIELSDLKL